MIRERNKITDGHLTLVYGTKPKQKLEPKDALLNINCTQAAERAKCRFLSLVTLSFDLWTWPSNSPERGT